MKMGGLKNIQDIDESTRRAISSLETYEEFEGYGEEREKVGDTKKIKLIDKTKALELLGKHLGMFKEKVDINQDKPFEVNINIKKATNKNY